MVMVKYCITIVLSLYIVAIVTVDASSDIIGHDTVTMYCSGDSQALAEQYVNGAQNLTIPNLLILADSEHIQQIIGIEKTIELLELLSTNAQSPYEKMFINDIADISKERFYKNDVKGNQRWYIYDNSKEPMPKSVISFQTQLDTLILPDKNKIAVMQSCAGYIPVKQYTQILHATGLCSASFELHKPVSMYVFSNMEYAIFINGTKVCVNTTPTVKKDARIIHIEPQEGFSIAIYYKPDNDMYLKILFRDETNATMQLPATDTMYYNPVNCYEIFYEYQNQLLSNYMSNHSPDNALQLALFSESIHSTEAFKYYHQALRSHNDFISYRLCSLLLRYSRAFPDSILLLRTNVQKNIQPQTVLGGYFYDMLYSPESMNIAEIQWLPILIQTLYMQKEELINKKADLDFLLKRFPQSHELVFTIASIYSSYDNHKATTILETYKNLNDRELTLLIHCYTENKQFEKIVTILAGVREHTFFYDYINALIALGKYGEAKSALFKTIAQGFDTEAYALLATIAQLEGYDASMYSQKHHAIVNSLVVHPDYMKATFDDYVHNYFFKQLAYEIINHTTNKLMYSCYAVRMVHDALYCTIYDAYHCTDISVFNTYQFSHDTENISYTLYAYNNEGKMKSYTFYPGNYTIQQKIQEYLHDSHCEFFVIAISFRLRKNIDIMHIQQNYKQSPFTLDIIVLSPESDVTIAGTMRLNEITTNVRYIHHYTCNSNELLSPSNREFVIMAIQPQALIAWIEEQNALFKRGIELLDIKEIQGNSIDEAIHEVLQELQTYTIADNVYGITSIVQWTLLHKGTQLDAMLYARYLLAKKGIISCIALGDSHKKIVAKKNNLYFDTVFLYIPLTPDKGIWLTYKNSYPSSEVLNISNILLIVGGEIISKQSN